jgi:tetratricopeptide (TPR) repeat protein
MDTQQIPVREETFADKIAGWVIIALVFLAPLFFIPSALVPFQFTKVILIYTAVIVSFIAWIIGRLKDGKLSLARHSVFLALLGVVAAYLVASLVSLVRSHSFLGQGFEVSTFAFIATMALFVFLISNIFTDRRRVAYAYLAFLASFALVALYQFIRLLFGPSALSLNVLLSPTDNLVGSWNDLGIYFGATALFSFLSLELLRMPRMLRVVCILILAVSLFFLSVVNFVFVWYILGIFALIFFIYNFSFNKARITQASPVASNDGRRGLPVMSLIVLIIAFIFILMKGNIYNTLSTSFGLSFFNHFAVNNIEVSPSWSSTFAIAKSVIRHEPLFGIGPNRFVNAWLQAKPQAVNNTIFWSTDFNYGIGMLPTFIVTTGLVGILAWIVFLCYFVYLGFRALFARVQDGFTSYISISSFILSLYFWIFLITHVPSAPLVALTFVFTGIFLASAADINLIPQRSYDIVKDPRTSFVSVLVLIGILLGVVVFGYDIGKRYFASIYFNNAIAAANSAGDVGQAEINLSRAVTFSADDQYYRTLSQLYLVKINLLLQQQNVAQDVLTTQFQSDLRNAQVDAQSALSIDPTNYQNWLAAGDVYAAVVPFNYDTAYEQAMANYVKAQQLNPLNPAIPLAMARLEIAHKDSDKAKNNIANAIQLKNDYSDAIYLLAQMQINQGDLKSAIKSVEALTFTDPNDPGVFFQLGLLRYNNKDYQGAASALVQATTLTPDYANAKYFLGLSYAKLGKTADALKQFQDIQKTNPDNKEIVQIINNLQLGRDPLSSIQPPNNTPEKASNPPVKDQPSPKADTSNR